MTRDRDWQPAYLLHARPYRETSVLADFFLPARGRVAAVLRGARRKGQTMPAPFQPWFIQLAGAGDLHTVTAAEPAGMPLSLTGNALFSGLYLNELLVRLLPRDLAQGELFVAYAGALGELAEATSPDAIEPALRRFERQLLDAMGQSISHERQADTDQPLQATLHYQYYPQHGWLPAREGQTGAWSGADILAVGRDELDTPSRRRLAKALYRAALAPLLGDRPLKSRDLFLAMQPAKPA